MNMSKFLFLLSFWTIANGLDISEILTLFGDKDCIAGSLLDLTEEATNDKNPLQIDVPENAPDISIDTFQFAITFIEEIARHNSISNVYELASEEGPAHAKVFTIDLQLGDETYTGTAPSLKKAQRVAALAALRSTAYEHPPIKIKESSKKYTPLMQLNQLAAKLGIKVEFDRVTDLGPLDGLKPKLPDVSATPKSYLEKLNDSVHSNDTIRIRRDAGDEKGPFTIKITLNDRDSFFGRGHTVKSAKHDAASQALKSIQDNERAYQCRGDACKYQKSPVSAVYEGAQQRNLAASFELVDETGPAHKKTFTMKCTVGTLESFGDGRSKKAAKKLAAENMLPKLETIPPIEGKKINVDHDQQMSKKKKKKKIIKSTMDKVDMVLDSVMEFGKNLVNTIGNTVEEDVDDDEKPKKKKQQRRSPAKDAATLGKLLNLNIQYSDLSNSGKTYSILELGTKPIIICLGEGINQKNSRDLASKYGIDVLYKLGLLDGLYDKLSTIEGETEDERAFIGLWMETVKATKVKDEL